MMVLLMLVSLTILPFYFELVGITILLTIENENVPYLIIKLKTFAFFEKRFFSKALLTYRVSMAPYFQF